MAKDHLSNDSEPTVFAAGYLVFRKSQRLEFLLMKHPDRWDLPKGHFDEGETSIEASKRELWEETGIPSDAIWTDPVFRFVHRYWVAKRKKPQEKSLKELTIYLGTLLRPIELVCTEHLDFKWWDWDPPHAINTCSGRGAHVRAHERTQVIGARSGTGVFGVLFNQPRIDAKSINPGAEQPQSILHVIDAAGHKQRNIRHPRFIDRPKGLLNHIIQRLKGERFWRFESRCNLGQNIDIIDPRVDEESHIIVDCTCRKCSSDNHRGLIAGAAKKLDAFAHLVHIGQIRWQGRHPSLG